MKRRKPPQNQSNHWRILLYMFLSFFPILAGTFTICVVVGWILSYFLIQNTNFILAGLCVIFPVAILSPFIGALVYRISARAFPLKVSKNPNFVYLRIIKITLSAILIAWFGLAIFGYYHVLKLINIVADPNPDYGTPLAIVVEAILLNFCTTFIFLSTCLIWSLVKIIKFHKYPQVWSSKGFILFLRSFGSVSDSAALSPLIHGSGFYSRVVLLSSPKEIRSSWDPMTLSVAGFSFRHPFHTVPVYLESTEFSWEDDVRRLAASASLVIIDISHQSPGLSLEIEILNKLGVEDKTLKFREIFESNDRKGSSDGLRGDVLYLERSRFKRFFSQAFSFTLTYLGFLTLNFIFGWAIFAELFNNIWAIGISSLLSPLIPALFFSKVLSPTAGFTTRSSTILVQAIKHKLFCSKQL